MTLQLTQDHEVCEALPCLPRLDQPQNSTFQSASDHRQAQTHSHPVSAGLAHHPSPRLQPSQKRAENSRQSIASPPPLPLPYFLLPLLCVLFFVPVPAAAVKIYVYDLPEKFGVPDFRWDWTHLLKRFKECPARTLNGDEADYFFIPPFKTEGLSDPEQQERILQVFNYVKSNFPWWNRTFQRHFLTAIYDHGPGDNMWWRPIRTPNPDVPDEFNPASGKRNFFFLMWNGHRDGFDANETQCGVCFQKGVDIMIPTAHNVCGPICGYPIETLRKRSMWSPEFVGPPKNRTKLLFYGGRIRADDIHDYTGRYQIYSHYKNHSDYLIANTGPPDEDKVDFSEEMPQAEFCYSPMGSHGGDTDRYVPAVLFGCIPVMLSENNRKEPFALPFEEVLPWRLFSVSVKMTEIGDLDARLRNLLPHVEEMRRQLKRAVNPLLWTSIYGSYFGETKSHDAFHTLLRVLKKRLHKAGTIGSALPAGAVTTVTGPVGSGNSTLPAAVVEGEQEVDGNHGSWQALFEAAGEQSSVML